MLVFVMLLVAIFAISIFALDTSKVTINDVTFTSSGFATGGSPAVLFDGKTACSGYYAWSNAEYYCKPGAGTLTFEFQNAVKLSSLTIYANGNWASVQVTVYDSGDNIVHQTSQNVSIGENEAGTFNYFSNQEFECKKVVISQAATNKIIRISEVEMTAHFHSYETEEVAPTCTEPGYTKYTCTCGDTKTEEIPAAHKWSETLTAVYGSEPTCVAPGKGVYYCDVCWAESEQYDMPIDPKGHKYESIIFNSAYTFATCADCNGYYFNGTNNGIDTDYNMYLTEGRFNIYKDDWSFDEYYGYTEVSIVDNVYTFTLALDAEAASETFLGATVVITINEDESLYISLTKDDTTYYFGKDPNAKEDLSALLNGTYQYVEGDVVIFEFVLENGTVTWTIAGGEENGAEATYSYDGTTFECDFNISLNDEGNLVYSAFHPINGAVEYVLTEYVEEEPEPEPEPEVNYGDKIGSIDVTTTDTYSWIDQYTYTADKAGQYSFFVPANLGLYSKAQYDARGNAEADYQGMYPNVEGMYVVVTLEAGEAYTFYVGAASKANWTIDVYYAEPQPVYEDEFNGTYANGTDLIFVFDNGTLTVTDNTGFFNIGGEYTYGYNAELGEFKLNTENFTLNVSSGSLFLNGRVPLTVYVPETITEVVLGENSFILENVNYRYGEVKVVFKATAAGTYIISASETGLVIIEGEYGAEMVDLPYTVTLAAGEEFAFIVTSGANVLTTTEDTVVITVSEKPSHECAFDTLVSIEYANGYLAEGVKTFKCECGETNTEVAPVIFTFSGYSVKEDGTALCVGYAVNRVALVAYEEANDTTVKFGVVNAGYDNLVNADGKPVNADGTAAEVSKGYVALKSVESTSYTSFEIKMVSANWSAIADVNVILCAYVIEGDKVSYICGNEATDAAVAITYNAIVGGNA